MVKLNDQENNDEIEVEMAQSEVKLPRDARSYFSFEIKENIDDLLKEMRDMPRKNKPQERFVDETTGEVSFSEKTSKAWWKFIERQEGQDRDSFGDFQLYDEESDCEAKIWQDKEHDWLGISTAWSNYTYKIWQNEGNGCYVEFDGPVNGLLNQQLLPSMTYVPGTLQGMFVDPENQEALTAWMYMAEFGALRSVKNGHKDGEGQANRQDCYGYQINARFNNEIPFLPQSHSEQEMKLYHAQKDFIEGKQKVVSEWKKDNVRKNIDRVRGKLSGAAVADKIAEEKISGKEKRTITPEVGAELATAIRKRKSAEK